MQGREPNKVRGPKVLQLLDALPGAHRWLILGKCTAALAIARGAFINLKSYHEVESGTQTLLLCSMGMVWRPHIAHSWLRSEEFHTLANMHGRLATQQESSENSLYHLGASRGLLNIRESSELACGTCLTLLNHSIVRDDSSETNAPSLSGVREDRTSVITPRLDCHEIAAIQDLPFNHIGVSQTT